ncbi:MAG: hybrid sensor histidine kinase/response regulator, partial [Alphaproteobacteria bacterium]|nr:hybrid sensor histidine kinase/response regulator [Alphaproteobacteria bacterium]
MESLLRIRSRATEILAIYLALHVPVIALVAWLHDKPWLAPTLGAAMIAAIVGGMAMQMRHAPATRYTLAAGLMGMVSIILFTMSGDPWQLDVHMYYFAGLAMVAAFCCWRTVLVAAAVVAVHHL